MSLKLILMFHCCPIFPPTVFLTKSTFSPHAYPIYINGQFTGLQTQKRVSTYHRISDIFTRHTTASTRPSPERTNWVHTYTDQYFWYILKHSFPSILCNNKLVISFNLAHRKVNEFSFCSIPIILQYSNHSAVFLSFCSTPIILQYSYHSAVFLSFCSTPIILQYSYHSAVFLSFCSIPIILQYSYYSAVFLLFCSITITCCLNHFSVTNCIKMHTLDSIYGFVCESKTR